MKHRQHVSTLKHLRCKKYSVLKLTQFSQGNNVLHALASNTDGFLLRDTCVFQLSGIGLFGTTWAILHLENYDLHEVFIPTHTCDRERM
jgi:hypothetical protein